MLLNKNLVTWKTTLSVHSTHYRCCTNDLVSGLTQWVGQWVRPDRAGWCSSPSPGSSQWARFIQWVREWVRTNAKGSESADFPGFSGFSGLGGHVSKSPDFQRDNVSAKERDRR